MRLLKKQVFMNKKISPALNIIAIFFGIINFTACSKGSNSPAPPPDACAGKTIVITATPTATEPCTAEGKIDVSATGSTNFMYKLKSTGTYQLSGKFTNVADGNYTVFAKDGTGCENSVAVTITSSGAAGPLFTAVKALVTAKCLSCHNNSNSNGGMNWSVECNIVINKTRIKVRAVDEGTMPQSGPLSQGDKDIITNWINGGGGYIN